LVITKTGLVAVGMHLEIAGERKQAADGPTQKVECGSPRRVSQNQRRMPRAGTKLAVLVGMLAREGGATVEEIAGALGWQEHTVRGVMSGALVKRFGLAILSEKVEGRGRVYRLC
jgi:hypothetical protein